MAITDHDTMDGALKIAQERDFLVVPGMEISSSDGHIVGLNLREPIPAGLSAIKTVGRIHEAGGIAIACHPTGFFKGHLGKHINSSFDAVEVINSSAIPFSRSVKNNMKIASSLGKPCVAGSDAHYAPEVGCAYTLINAEPNLNELIKAISRGMCQPFGTSIPLATRFRRIIEINKRKL